MKIGFNKKTVFFGLTLIFAPVLAEENGSAFSEPGVQAPAQQRDSGRLDAMTQQYQQMQARLAKAEAEQAAQEAEVKQRQSALDQNKRRIAELNAKETLTRSEEREIVERTVADRSGKVYVELTPEQKAAAEKQRAKEAAAELRRKQAAQLAPAAAAAEQRTILATYAPPAGLPTEERERAARALRAIKEAQAVPVEEQQAAARRAVTEAYADQGRTRGLAGRTEAQLRRQSSVRAFDGAGDTLDIPSSRPGSAIRPNSKAGSRPKTGRAK